MAQIKHDGINWHAFAHVDKYTPEVVRELTEHLGYEPKAADFARMSITPNATAEADGNLLTTAGLQRITNLIIASGAASLGTSTTTGKSGIGVGSTTTTATVSDVKLGADNTAANGTVGAWYQSVDSAPTAVNGVLTSVSTFASGDGNFAWQEWCWFISTGTFTAAQLLDATHPGATTNQILNHKIASLGTKASGASWVFTTTVTLS